MTLSRDQERAAFAKRRTPKAAKRKVPVSRLKTGSTVVRSGPLRVVLGEDQRAPGQRIYEIHDAKQHLGIVGSEVSSLMRWWRRERQRRAPASGEVFRTGPHGEHGVVVLQDSKRVASRVYRLQGRTAAITIEGRHLDRIATWWEGERQRRGEDRGIGRPPNPVLAAEMGRNDADIQVGYILDEGGTVEEGIRAHRAFRKVGDLGTAEHGDDAAFHKASEAYYRDARRVEALAAKLLKGGSAKTIQEARKLAWKAHEAGGVA